MDMKTQYCDTVSIAFTEEMVWVLGGVCLCVWVFLRLISSYNQTLSGILIRVKTSTQLQDLL